MRESKPWYRKGRGYFVQINRKQHFLGHEKAEAYRAFYALMAGVTPASTTVADVVGKFSTWVEKNRSEGTADWYTRTLKTFVAYYPSLAVRDLRPFHVVEWADSYKVSSGTKRNYYRAVKRAMSFAEEQGYIDENPIRRLRLPPPTYRDIVITDSEYATVLAAATTIKDLIEFVWETGARASEVVKLERRHVDGMRIVLPRSEEKMRRAPRIIYLSPRAKEIVDSCAKNGILFRNSDGRPWTTVAVVCAFQRMKENLGQQYCLTHFRHAFAHRLLKAGIDSITVAALMGHAPGSNTLSKVYAHINHASEHLTGVLAKAAG